MDDFRPADEVLDFEHSGSPPPSNAQFPRSGAPKANACSSCAMRSACLPRDMCASAHLEIESLVYAHRRVRRGEHVFLAGDPFQYLYAFRSGFFKSYVDSPDGHTQVIGFPMAGDVTGLDGIESGQYQRNVVALDDGEACVIPYRNFQRLATRSPRVQEQLVRILSREIVREQGVMAMLAGMRAEARVASFLLSLSRRFAERGYSRSKFLLRMTREEIGSYLGLKLETVSRALSNFQEKAWIRLSCRSVEIVDLGKLHALVQGT